MKNDSQKGTCNSGGMKVRDWDCKQLGPPLESGPASSPGLSAFVWNLSPPGFFIWCCCSYILEYKSPSPYWFFIYINSFNIFHLVNTSIKMDLFLFCWIYPRPLVSANECDLQSHMGLFCILWKVLSRGGQQEFVVIPGQNSRPLRQGGRHRLMNLQSGL